MSQHPLITGHFSYKQAGKIVRHKATGEVGTIVYARIPGPLSHDQRPELWIVYPPSRLVKTWSAGSAHVDGVVVLRQKSLR